MENEPWHIRYTPLAYEDLDNIDTYISTVLLSPQAALRCKNESLLCGCCMAPGNTEAYYKVIFCKGLSH